MSPATSPAAGPRAAPPRRAATRRRRGAERIEPGASRAPMMPDSTSPVPAVASRASPLATTSTSPPGAATTVAGPLSSTTRAQVGSQPAGGERSGRRPGDARRAAPYSPSWGVSTVGDVRRCSTGAGAVGVPRQREQPVAVDDDRHGRPAIAVARTAATVYGSRPRPGPTTRAWKRSRSSSTWLRPVERRQPPAARPPAGAVAVGAGRRQRHHAAAGAHRGRRARWAAPVMPGLPATTRTARDPLVRRRRARPPPPGDVARPRRDGPGPGGCRARCRRPRRRRRGRARRRAAAPA